MSTNAMPLDRSRGIAFVDTYTPFASDRIGASRNHSAQTERPTSNNMFAPGQCMTLNIPPVTTAITDPTSMPGHCNCTDKGPGLRNSRSAKVAMTTTLLATTISPAPGQCRVLNRMPMMRPAIPMERMYMVVVFG